MKAYLRISNADSAQMNKTYQYINKIHKHITTIAQEIHAYRSLRFILCFYPALLLLIPCGDNSARKKERIQFGVVAPIKPVDTITQAFFDGRYYSPYIIRLGTKYKRSFINIDSAYFNIAHLTPAERETYYQKVVGLLPKEDVQVYQLIWALPEMHQLLTADGGPGTIVTWIKDRPSEHNDKYVVEIRKNEIKKFRLEKDLAYFRISLHPIAIEIATESEYYVPLKKWRSVIR